MQVPDVIVSSWFFIGFAINRLYRFWGYFPCTLLDSTAIRPTMRVSMGFIVYETHSAFEIDFVCSTKPCPPLLRSGKTREIMWRNLGSEGVYFSFFALNFAIRC